MIERVAGGLLGVAAGDALGATVEFCSPERIVAELGVHTEIVGGGAFGWRPGQGTDDTDLTACVARAYADGYELWEVARRFLEWYAGGPRDVGGLTARALGWLAEHGDPRSSGAAVSTGDDAGNGSLMRALPTALVHRSSASPSGNQADVDGAMTAERTSRGRAARLREAAEISGVTHADARCVQACQVYVEMAAELLHGGPVQQALRAAGEIAEHPEVVGALRVDPGLHVSRLRTTGYVVHSLTAAVWAVQQRASFEELVVAVVNRGDDADTTGAIVGGLLGVRDGVQAIPKRWLERLEYRREFERLAERLSAGGCRTS